MSLHPGKCCLDYEKSKWAKCQSCGQFAQVMASLGMCQHCTTGTAEEPLSEVWKKHSLECYKLKSKPKAESFPCADCRTRRSCRMLGKCQRGAAVTPEAL